MQKEQLNERGSGVRGFQKKTMKLQTFVIPKGGVISIVHHYLLLNPPYFNKKKKTVERKVANDRF